MRKPNLTSRSAGILLHPTSLPGPFGAGDLGPVARRFADHFQKAGLRWWQMLPVTPPGPAPAIQVADLNDVAIPDLDPSAPNVLEEAANQPQAPSPTAPATEGIVPAAMAAPAEVALGDGPKVPNFEGLSKRAVVAEAQAQGLAVSLTGAGIARTQAPPPGGILHPGERIRVGFVK